ncbi:MAG: hypothetical protein VR69_00935 [Peptococcaceae bacterium BRH_c4b]|nr:MAG: hypothetical protein VR69_00935 [Peptococcaceae bacterium BRH_c4b]
MTASPCQLLAAFVAGTGLGLFFFGGLWLTVQLLPISRRPGLLTVTSVILRMGISLIGFYLVMGGRWERLLVCLAGFVLVRYILIRRTGPVKIRAGSISGRRDGNESES